MALSGLDIYKLLPKTNCKACGFPTCLAFAMQLAKKAVTLEKCPYICEEAKQALELASQPPVKLITVGSGDEKLEIGNETVMFRHEEKFHHPCGLGFILEDNTGAAQIKEDLLKINQLKFERVGQQLSVNLIAVRHNSDAKIFLEAVKLVADNTALGLVLMSKDPTALKEALKICGERRPLLYAATSQNFSQMADLAKEFKCPLVATAADLVELSNLSKELNKQGVNDLVLDTGKKNIAEKLWDLTQIRRQALKKSQRSLGYPTLAVIENSDPEQEVLEAATYIAKYAGIILLKGQASWQALSLLTLRQNIYTDPQKPLQIEPKLYAIGQVSAKSPLLVTTNFSLTYYTVLGEVEASKIPAYILSVDTEGMSVLTAWAAEKFTAEKINESINKFAVKETVKQDKVVIPGYVAVISGELEDKTGWSVIVGPKEASGIPSFLKNL